MKKMSRLSHLRVGQCGRIGRLEADPPLKRRLQDLGFVPGTKIVCAYRSPLGDPTAFWVKETLIALRREDALRIYLEQETKHVPTREK